MKPRRGKPAESQQWLVLEGVSGQWHCTSKNVQSSSKHNSGAVSTSRLPLLRSLKKDSSWQFPHLQSVLNTPRRTKNSSAVERYCDNETIKFPVLYSFCTNAHCIMAQKRPLEEGPQAAVEPSLASSAKRPRTEQTSIVAIESEASATTALIKSEQAPARTSKMQAPIMMLEGHTGPVYTVAVSTARLFGRVALCAHFASTCSVCIKWTKCGDRWQGQEHL